MKASVIIPYYKTPHFIRKNMPAVIAAKENMKNRIDEVILIDDGSKDECAKIIKQEFPEVRLITHKVNRGFSATVNTGARSAKSKLLVLLNTDVIPSKDFLESVLPHFKDEGVFGVSFHESGYGWAKGKFEDGFILHEPGRESKKTHDTFWISGGSGVFRRSYWMKLGGMDEKLLSPFYWEDVDLSYKAAKRGWKVLWEPKARVLHRHEGTVGSLPNKRRVQRIQERNQLIFIWKNITSPILFRKHMTGLFKRVTRHPGYIRIVLMAALRIKGIREARKKENKESKVSDEAIFAKFS
ncbi:glycosyltransferase family 2 protein [Patescibacteria group bacterium]|nr:glycosyltransferase family 2 protein [Patescibacteria group bacterium]